VYVYFTISLFGSTSSLPSSTEERCSSQRSCQETGLTSELSLGRCALGNHIGLALVIRDE